MMTVSPQEAQFLEGLSSLVASGDLPSSVHRSCEGLLERLNAPVRIGIFGVPGSGKKHVLNTLVGEGVALNSPLVPTLEMVPGPLEHTTAVLADGATLDMPGYPDADILSQHPVFLSITSPACTRDRRSYVLTVCDETLPDMIAGLEWAAQRVDLAIWCTDCWTEAEAEVWRHAPEHLQDHSILCCTSALDDEPGPPTGFDSVFRVQTDSADRYAQLERHLQTVINEARAQDIVAAELFLRRYTDLSIDAPAIEPRADADAEALQPVSDLARSQLAFLFRHVRKSADRLRRSLRDDPELLGPLETVFEALADQAAEFEAIAKTWPEIDAAVSEARDLALLLRLEGGADQASDAARLLLQLRWDMETKLAA